MPSRKDALSLLQEWVKSESLRKHCLSVATAMEGYGKKYLDEGKIDIDSLIRPHNNTKQLSDKYQEGIISNNNLDINDKTTNNQLLKGGIDDKGNLSEQEKQAILDKYWITGLLHDFDYEKYPDINVHPKPGCEELKKLGYEEEIINAILGHNNKTGVKRENLMAKTLFSVDELCGLIVALAYVRPGNLEGMSSQSIKKAMKKKDFAAAINREDIKQGIIELGINENEHFETIIKALSERKELRNNGS